MRSKIRLFTALLPIFPIGLLSTSAQAFNPDHLAQLLKTNQCANCDLSNAKLENANLTGANLQGANLSGATLTRANLSNANLEVANLQGTSLTEAYLFGSNLTGANFTNAKLENANLRETTLVGTNFSGADLRSSDFQGNNLGQAKFPGSNLSNANLSKTIGVAVISNQTRENQAMIASFAPHFICTIPQQDDKSGVESLNQIAEESGFKIQTVDFSGANLTSSTLQNALLVNTNLSNVDLTGANLRSACLVLVNLTGAKLTQADLTDIRLTSTSLPPGTTKPPLSAVAQATAKAATRRVKTSEAKTYVGSMNRGQQAYYLENNRFTTSSQDLGFGTIEDTETYKYRLFIAPDRFPAVMNVALSQRDDLPTFIGFVRAEKTPKDDPMLLAILCTSENPATPMPLWSAIDYKNPKKGEPIACPKGFTPVK